MLAIPEPESRAPCATSIAQDYAPDGSHTEHALITMQGDYCTSSWPVMESAYQAVPSPDYDFEVSTISDEACANTS